MAAGLPDLVDCARLAEEAAVLERTYELRELPRLKEFLAQPQGVVNASFALMLSTPFWAFFGPIVAVVVSRLR